MSLYVDLTGTVRFGEFSLPSKTENAGGQMGRLVSDGAGQGSPGSYFPLGRLSGVPGSGYSFFWLVQFCLHMKAERKAIRMKK